VCSRIAGCQGVGYVEALALGMMQDGNSLGSRC
jgi:hypothetical protein